MATRQVGSTLWTKAGTDALTTVGYRVGMAARSLRLASLPAASA